jgi:peptide deformylase
MALRKIITKENSMLRKNSRPVTKFDDRLAMLLDDMAETMYAADGVGLAAVQVATLRRAIVIDVGTGLMELVNPEIIETEGEQCAEEGCLSIPNEYYETIRPEKVKVKAQDRHGEWHEYEGQGLLARCFCHEIDHLDGVLFIDRKNPHPTQSEDVEVEEDAE